MQHLTRLSVVQNHTVFVSWHYASQVGRVQPAVEHSVQKVLVRAFTLVQTSVDAQIPVVRAVV